MRLQPSPRRRSLRRAFTLMEVLVVVAIIVVLAGIATVSFRYLSDAKVDATKARIKQVETAVMSYNMRYKHFPTALTDLLTPPEGSQAYLDQADLVDEWGQPLQYDASQISTTGKPLIMSAGEPGGNRPPIRNWE